MTTTRTDALVIPDKIVIPEPYDDDDGNHSAMRSGPKIKPLFSCYNAFLSVANVPEQKSVGMCGTAVLHVASVLYCVCMLVSHMRSVLTTVICCSVSCMKVMIHPRPTTTTSLAWTNKHASNMSN